MDVVVVASAQSPVFVVVVTPFTELTETLQELLAAQPELFVVVVTPFTDVTETLHDDELCTTTLLDTVVPAGVSESPAEACPSARRAPSAASARSARNTTALRMSSTPL